MSNLHTLIKQQLRLTYAALGLKSFILRNETSKLNPMYYIYYPSKGMVLAAKKQLEDAEQLMAELSELISNYKGE